MNGKLRVSVIFAHEEVESISRRLAMKQIAIVIGAVALASIGGAAALHARNQDAAPSARITFSQSVEVPGRILPPGTYNILLVQHGLRRDTVQFSSSDGAYNYVTNEARPVRMKSPATEALATLAPAADGKGEALMRFVFAGNRSGEKFVYAHETALRANQPFICDNSDWSRELEFKQCYDQALEAFGVDEGRPIATGNESFR
jgi:hypothetical protein